MTKESNFFGKIFRGDTVIWCIFIFLCLISLIEVYSASSTIIYRQQHFWTPIFKHGMHLFVGLGVVMFMQRLPSKNLEFLLLGMPLSIILLIYTLFAGLGVNQAKRWIEVGGLFTIQPSEIAKVSMIVFLSFFLSKMKPENEKWVFKLMLIGLVSICGLIFMENFSTAVLLFLVSFLLMFIGQVKLIKLGKVVLFGFVVLTVFVGGLALLPESFVDDYMSNTRVSTWKARLERHGEEEEILNEDGSYTYQITDNNFQVTHAKIAIAKGIIPGLPGTSEERDVLPQAYSDFIYAIILEETGLIGGLFVLMLYLTLLFRAGILANKCEKKFPRYLILGSALMLCVQALINMSVAVNLIPVTGQPLPLISKGGTATIITCAYFGIILACSAKQNYEHHDVDESVANVDFGIAEDEENWTA